MPCCCLRVLNLCNVPVCGSLVIEKVAEGLPSGAESGALNEYQLKIDFLNTQITLTEEQTDGENIHFDVSALNENFEFTGEVYDSEGNKVTITIGEVEYDCVKFKTIMGVSL